MTSVDFFVFSPHEVALWRPIVHALRRRNVDARWILEPVGKNRAALLLSGTYRGYADDELIETVVRLLAEDGDLPLFEGRYESADAIVTTAGINVVEHYAGIKLRCGYGVGAFENAPGFGEPNREFDVVLTHGDFYKSRMKRWLPEERIYCVGFPKYAPYFRDGLDTERWRRRWGLDPSKPTVAYFSTWAHNSSLDRFAPTIASLAGEYNVIYKPHQANLRFESGRWDALRHREGVTVDEDTPTIIPFLDVADLVVADVRSGSFTEPMLVNRRVIGLSSGDRFQDNLVDGIDRAAAICMHPRDLRGLVEEELASDSRAAGRKEFSNLFFRDCGGRDDDVAADAILEIIDARARPALRGLRIASAPPTQPAKQQIAAQKTASVIITAAASTGYLAQCLAALERQSVDRSSVDVTVIEPLPGWGHSQILGKEAYGFSVRHLTDYDSSVQARNVAVELSDGDVLLFLDGNTVPASDWLERHLVRQDAGSRLVIGRTLPAAPEPQDILTRVLGRSTLVHPSADLSSGPIPWHEVRLSNLSVSRTALQEIGGLDESISHDVGAAMDMALRLQDGDTPIVYDSAITCTHNASIDIDTLRAETVASTISMVETLTRSPKALISSPLARYASLTTHGLAELHDSQQVGTESVRIYALQELSHLRPGRMALFGDAFAQLGSDNESFATTLLAALFEHWQGLGIEAVLQRENADSLTALLARRPINTSTIRRGSAVARETPATLDRVLKIVRRVTGQSVTPDTPLLSTGLVSLAIGDLADVLSDTFGVPLGVEDLGFDNADTARQLASFIDRSIT